MFSANSQPNIYEMKLESCTFSSLHGQASCIPISCKWDHLKSMDQLVQEIDDLDIWIDNWEGVKKGST